MRKRVQMEERWRMAKEGMEHGRNDSSAERTALMTNKSAAVHAQAISLLNVLSVVGIRRNMTIRKLVLRHKSLIRCQMQVFMPIRYMQLWASLKVRPLLCLKKTAPKTLPKTSLNLLAMM